MKRLLNGVIVLDRCDIALLSWIVGSILAQLFRSLYPEPIEKELKRISPKVIPISASDGKPIVLPVVRGGEIVLLNNGLSIIKRSLEIRKFAALLCKLYILKAKYRKYRLLAQVFQALHIAFSATTGIYIAAAGNIQSWELTFLALTGTMGGFTLEYLVGNPLFSMALPITLLLGKDAFKGASYAKQEDYCKQLCDSGTEYYNQQARAIMEKHFPEVIEQANREGIFGFDQILKCKQEVNNSLTLETASDAVYIQKSMDQLRRFFDLEFPECTSVFNTKAEYREQFLKQAQKTLEANLLKRKNRVKHFSDLLGTGNNTFEEEMILDTLAKTIPEPIKVIVD